MELTPRTNPDLATPRSRQNRKPWVYLVLALVLAGLAVVVYQGLTSASLYFYNADEAVEERSELGDRRFRMQGLVVDGSVISTQGGVRFTVTYDGVDVAVRHAGDPPELFQPGIPVVIEGRWHASGEHFDSDTIRVKHSEQYQAENPDRIDDAERQGSASTTADRTP